MAASNWKRSSLGELCSKIGSGATPRGGKDAYKDSGTPLVRSMNVYDFGFDRDGLAYIDDDQAERLKGSDIRPGDVLLNITGASVARCCIAPPSVHGGRVNQHVAILRPKPELLDSNFLAYLLASSIEKPKLLSIAQAGATREALTKGGLEQYGICCPPLKTQKYISSILRAYDDLIENNTRRIEILEEMALRLYEEWFVHFRFPGHDEVSFKESELGRIPEGWAVGTLQDVIVLQRGFDLPVKKRTPGGVPIISATGGSGTHNEAKVEGPGVITGRSGSIGKVMYTHGDYWPLNTTLWGKLFPLGSTLFAFYTLSSIDLKGFNVGAAVPTLNRNDIHGLPVVVPIKNSISSFDQSVEPMHKQMDTLKKKNVNLRAQRDLLLPKLVSGEIDVSDNLKPNDKEIEAA